MGDLFCLKISKDNPIARCISIVRKIEPSLTVSGINSRIKNDEYVLSCDLTDKDGLKKIICCFNRLEKNGIDVTLFKDDIKCDADMLKDLVDTFDKNDDITEEEDEGANDDLIFEYKLYNAWMFPIVSLSVYDRSEDNVRCIVWLSTVTPTDLPLAENYSLDRAEIQKISYAIRSNYDLFGIDEVETPFVLDGFSNGFFFRDGSQKIHLDASNIAVYVTKRSSCSKKKPVNAGLLLSVYERIKNILIQNGVDGRYLALEL